MPLTNSMVYCSHQLAPQCCFGENTFDPSSSLTGIGRRNFVFSLSEGLVSYSSIRLRETCDKEKIIIEGACSTSCKLAGDNFAYLVSDPELSTCTFSSNSGGIATPLTLPFARSSKNSAGFMAISG